MGSSDSTCCGSHEGPPKTDIEDTGEAFKKQRTLKSYFEKAITQHKKYPKSLCITDLKQCTALIRIIIVIKKYNKWLDTKTLSNKKTLREMDVQTTINYHQYDADITQLINSIDKYSIEEFKTDAEHIKHEHHYQYHELRTFCREQLHYTEICTNNNCFSMKHYFLRNKQYTLNSLEMLTNLHIYMFHSIYISELKIQHVHPRHLYVIATYIEQIQRTVDIRIYQHRWYTQHGAVFPFKVVHLISFYYGGKFIEDNDILDKVSALGLAVFIEKMNEAKLEELLSKLDSDESDTIDVEEVDDLLFVIALLVIATERQKNNGKHRIDKLELKQLMKPIGDWVKRDKMVKQPMIAKKGFKKTFSEWLREYDRTNGGIIADEDMQTQVLKKYRVDDDERNENEEDVHDRLVVNCEHLAEHKSLKDDASLNPNAKSVTVFWKPS